jgi:seryl-tRNA synthetase
MVLDVEVVRSDPDRVRENQRKRFCDESLVDTVLSLDSQWKKGKRFFAN